MQRFIFTCACMCVGLFISVHVCVSILHACLRSPKENVRSSEGVFTDNYELPDLDAGNHFRDL